MTNRKLRLAALRKLGAWTTHADVAERWETEIAGDQGVGVTRNRIGVIVMTAPFDPYAEWLGIDDQRRPPTHYAILGL
ncbi:MAG: hypothetical protein RBS80_31735, partial [Thermoguttaceae bacterium]|nr:hypothetical protein [Thermoguttaceae bacterium]